MPSGRERTAALNSVIEKARNLAMNHALDSERVRTWMIGPGPQRIVALAMMDAKPALRDVDSILQAVAKPHSAYEQYHGLLLVDKTFDQMSVDEKRKTVGVLQGLTGLRSDPDQTRNELRTRVLNRWSA
jgi:hypothetical protein